MKRLPQIHVRIIMNISLLIEGVAALCIDLLLKLILRQLCRVVLAAPTTLYQNMVREWVPIIFMILWERNITLTFLVGINWDMGWLAISSKSGLKLTTWTLNYISKLAVDLIRWCIFLQRLLLDLSSIGSRLATYKNQIVPSIVLNWDFYRRFT